jgi:hypothetical protein
MLWVRLWARAAEGLSQACLKRAWCDDDRCGGSLCGVIERRRATRGQVFLTALLPTHLDILSISLYIFLIVLCCAEATHPPPRPTFRSSPPTMPTPLDRALHQRVRSPAHIEEKDVSSNAESKKAPLFAFGAIVTGIAAWSIWGSDIFPSTDPSGGRLSPFFLSFFLSSFLSLS